MKKWRSRIKKALKEKYNPSHTFIGAMAVNIHELRYGEGDNIEVHNK